MIKLIGAIKSQMSESQLTSEISFSLIADCSHWSKLHVFWAPARVLIGLRSMHLAIVLKPSDNMSPD